MPSASSNDLNVSRRLRRSAYVQVMQVLLILLLECTRHTIVQAMRELLESWSETDKLYS